jgi:ATP-dependent exoDNAse (exonuclease V) beta subunit
MAKTEESKRQEMNLKFVATTRAINELVYVKVKDKSPKKKKPVPASV